MGSVVRKRFRNFEIVVNDLADPSSVPTGEVVCVTGEYADCGATSGALKDGHRLSRWMAEHCRDTGHQVYDCIERTPLRVDI